MEDTRYPWRIVRDGASWRKVRGETILPAAIAPDSRADRAYLDGLRARTALGRARAGILEAVYRFLGV